LEGHGLRRSACLGVNQVDVTPPLGAYSPSVGLKTASPGLSPGASKPVLVYPKKLSLQTGKDFDRKSARKLCLQLSPRRTLSLEKTWAPRLGAAASSARERPRKTRDAPQLQLDTARRHPTVDGANLNRNLRMERENLAEAEGPDAPESTAL
jgi:hypothetical protein